jgi:hypothetical protein
LRCDIREKLISFLQENYPAALPRRRAELHGANGGPVDFEASVEARRKSG